MVSPPGSQGSAGSIPTSSGSATANHQHQNAVSSNHTNGRVHPPLQERSRNARAQARHRAKRKAYISQLEETVARLQAALSPPFGVNSPTAGVYSTSSSTASPNDQTHSSFGNSPSIPANAPGNAMINLGPSAAAGAGAAGQGSGGPDGTNLVARLRALELECTALRSHAETLRSLLVQHAPSVQIPPAPLPSSLPPSTPAAATSGPSSAHSNSSLGPGGTLRLLNNSTFPSISSASTTPTGPTSLSPDAYRTESIGKVIGVKRPRHDSHSRSLSESGSGPEREPDDDLDFVGGTGGNAGYSAPKTTPPLSGKSNAFTTPTHPSFPINSFNNVNANGGRAPPPLTLPPVPQPGPHLNVSHTNAHQAPLSGYPQQPLQSPLHQQHHHHQQHPQQHQHPQHQQQHQQQQQQQQSQAHAQQPPQMTPMPPPAPLAWGVAGGVSSVPSHGNSNAPAHGLQLPPPVPRFGTAPMPNLTRGFAYASNAPPPPPPSSTGAAARPDGLDGSATTSASADRNRIGSGISGLGLTGTGNGMVLKREEDGESGLATNNMYGSFGADSAYAYSQMPRHNSGRHQQHDSIHSISPISATGASPSTATAIVQQQEHYHPQIPSPHGPQPQHNYQPQQQPSSAAAQRTLPSPASHQQHQTQSHYSQHSNAAVPSPIQNSSHHLNHLQAPQQQAQVQPSHHQANATTLPSPHSPYPPPVSPSVSGPFRGGYPEERGYPHHHHNHHHQPGPQQQHQQHHASAHHHPNQNQNQNQSQSASQGHDQSYLWPPVHAGGVYGGR